MLSTSATPAQTLLCKSREPNSSATLAESCARAKEGTSSKLWRESAIIEQEAFLDQQVCWECKKLVSEVFRYGGH